MKCVSSELLTDDKEEELSILVIVLGLVDSRVRGEPEKEKRTIPAVF